MSDLEDALNYWSGMEEMSTCDRRHLRRIVEAARLWADHQGKCPLLITAVESDQPLYVDPEDVPF